MFTVSVLFLLFISQDFWIDYIACQCMQYLVLADLAQTVRNRDWQMANAQDSYFWQFSWDGPYSQLARLLFLLLSILPGCCIVRLLIVRLEMSGPGLVRVNMSDPGLVRLSIWCSFSFPDKDSSPNEP